MEESLKSLCDRLRTDLKEIERQARAIRDHNEIKNPEREYGLHGEIAAQSMLAVRHLEDARMRLGKVLQYADGGVSIYDKK